MYAYVSCCQEMPHSKEWRNVFLSDLQSDFFFFNVLSILLSLFYFLMEVEMMHFLGKIVPFWVGVQGRSLEKIEWYEC